MLPATMMDSASILKYLDCRPGIPNIRSLNRLIQAYIRKVPWETVFRITKRARTSDVKECPRWPDEFWLDAIQLGGGGTCYENNYALFCLLQSLGYSGYLTINDMGEQRGCHAAIVILFNEQKYLVDVGIPLLTAIPIDPTRVIRRSTWLHTYTLRPDCIDRYQVLRSHHPKPNIYTLLDTPISEPEYRQVVEQDYGEKGLFLDKVIVVKIIENRLWRFSSADRPYRLEWFSGEAREDISIPPDQVATILAKRFQMDERRIQAALEAVKK